MGLAFQTACPLCKHPLFSLNDRLIFCVSKASMSIQAVTSILQFLILYDTVQHYRYFNTAIQLALITFLGWMLVNAYIPLIKSGGENWWRPYASYKGGMGRAIGTVVFTFAINTAVLCQTLYSNRGLLF
ncbi:hypothetical protein QM012_004021 [Aureobasidium pullulans]|uniref:Uncharacterized protein n=1 Tax=Aureobasidium pullulans TaxID=5580 RepID=A0ABR0T6G6_AURPU